MLKADMVTMTKRFSTAFRSDPEVTPYAARVSVWGHWFIWLVAVFELAYRPGFWYPEDIEFLALFPCCCLMLNGLVHHRLLTNRPVTWRWLLFLGTMDIALITAGVVIHSGFESFIFPAYYPSLTDFCRGLHLPIWLSLTWTTTDRRCLLLSCV